MSEEPAECHIELESFEDLARLACSYQAHPRRIFSFVRDGSGGGSGGDADGNDGGDGSGGEGTRVAATAFNLANTLAVMYAPLPKNGRYVSYVIDGGRSAPTWWTRRQTPQATRP